MCIKKISLQNIKGISNLSLDYDIIPNKPSILVAPNGFGKSSFATGFDSLNSLKINLDNEYHHQNDDRNLPVIAIELKKADNSIVNLSADQTSNTISSTFDIVVINSRIEAKSRQYKFGGKTTSSASLEIKSLTLINTIPRRTNFTYNITSLRSTFGTNGKILPNITSLLNNKKLIDEIYQNLIFLQRSLNVTIKNRIQNIVNDINQIKGTIDNIIDWVENNKVTELENIQYVKDIKDIVDKYDLGFKNNAEKFLAVIKLIFLYESNKPQFEGACRYVLYEIKKQTFTEVFKYFNTTWKNIRPKESENSLVLTFPKAHNISNGERDVICFVISLLLAKQKMKKEYCILIIDEIFDYLDDANLISVQYYISELIEEFKKDNKFLYPLILTHLNPYYFKNFVFAKQKIYYLDRRTGNINNDLKKILENRENILIKTEVDKHYLHFEPTTANITGQFTTLNIRADWGNSTNFHNFLDQEIQKYITDQNYDAFAVCCSVRIKIEKIFYDKLVDPAYKTHFLSLHGTKKKLIYVEEKGLDVPDIFYLLGIIYNDALHWRQNIDNFSPTKIKLENLTIRKLIKEVFTQY